ncbi:hypothetical protein [Ferrimicrobium acidiphilum]|uniref:hypothetical protein n=1 Tax=Ferrimicrobium acidiphilum TaxID=121039 RepID=UPI0023F3632F|nr:hypothetical protein [Ferrimicrobium acidiphilum]
MAGSMGIVAQRDTWGLRVFIGWHSLEEVKHRCVRFRGRRRQGERELVRLVTGQEDKPAPLIESELAWSSSTTMNDAIAAWPENGWCKLSPTMVRHHQYAHSYCAFEQPVFDVNRFSNMGGIL